MWSFIFGTIFGVGICISILWLVYDKLGLTRKEKRGNHKKNSPNKEESSTVEGSKGNT